jgi:excinuclease UvrABC ATPase subunit
MRIYGIHRCPFCCGRGFFYITGADNDVDYENCEDCRGTGWSRRALRLWDQFAGRVLAWVW